MFWKLKLFISGKYYLSISFTIPYFPFILFFLSGTLCLLEVGTQNDSLIISFLLFYFLRYLTFPSYFLIFFFIVVLFFLGMLTLLHCHFKISFLSIISKYFCWFSEYSFCKKITWCFIMSLIFCLSGNITINGYLIDLYSSLVYLLIN